MGLQYKMHPQNWTQNWVPGIKFFLDNLKGTVTANPAERCYRCLCMVLLEPDLFC